MIERLITAQRHALADVLAELPERSWDEPSLCEGWRVREVVAHITMPFRYRPVRFLAELARDRGKFDRMADRCARRDATASTSELLAGLRDNESHPWQPPGGGPAGALTHDVVHGQDITVALGIPHVVPADTLLIVLGAVSGQRSRKHFGVDLSGVRLVASDLEWTLGDGAEEVRGAAQDLLMVLCGRVLPSGLLSRG